MDVSQREVTKMWALGTMQGPEVIAEMYLVRRRLRRTRPRHR